MEDFIQIYMFPSELILSAELFKAFIQSFQYDLDGERRFPLLEWEQHWCEQGKADSCSLLPQRDAAVWREHWDLIFLQYVTSVEMLSHIFKFFFK